MIKSKKEKSENEENDLKETEIPVNESGEDGQRQLNELNDQYLRKIAEFENFKKRTEAEKSDFYKYSNEKLILELLPVLDDFDRVMESYNDAHNAESFKKGVKLVYDKFKKVLQKQGLKQMDSDGKQFDVNLHEAVMQQPSEAKPDTIINTIEKGYFLKDKVLRHAKVIVSSKPE